jgi:molybdate transport system substrate-binding protein
MYRIIFFSLIALFFLTGCGREQSQSSAQQKKELLVFCGITMIDPIMELSKQFEREHGVKVKMTYGGSQDLAKSIEVNQIGDIYFPGVKKFVDELKNSGHVVNEGQVGHNQISFFVQKGNPKNITNDLNNLANPNLSVVIGHEDLGSVGREAKIVLMKKGIYKQVIDNAAFMASDSKGMTVAIREKRADLVMNWRSVYFLKDNAKYMDEIELDSSIATPHPLVISSLTHSKYPDLAEKYLALCTSAEGKKVFAKYGF